MGGRKPTSPQIVPSQPPRGDRVFMGGSADFDERTCKYRSTGTRRPPQKQRRDIGVGGGPGIPPRFPDQVNDPKFRRRQRKKEKREVFAPGFPSDGPRILPIFPGGGRRKERGVRPIDRQMPLRPRPPIDDLGPKPEREIPIPKERLPRITRESDPRGGAPFAPDERGMVRDRFFERMFEKADEAKQRKSMQKEERREVRQARNEERSARRMQPREINVGNERREIG